MPRPQLALVALLTAVSVPARAARAALTTEQRCETVGLVASIQVESLTPVHHAQAGWTTTVRARVLATAFGASLDHVEFSVLGQPGALAGGEPRVSVGSRHWLQATDIAPHATIVQVSPGPVPADMTAPTRHMLTSTWQAQCGPDSRAERLAKAQADVAAP